jgi:beta-N-acetylhexosaminidase
VNKLFSSKSLYKIEGKLLPNFFKFTTFLLIFNSLVLLFNPFSFGVPKEKSSLPADTTNQNPSNLKDIESQVENYLENLSLEKKIGQLFIFGFSGKYISPSLNHTISTFYPGGLIAFQRNLGSPSEIASLTSSSHNLSKKKSGLPLLMMIDQEGGNVSRLKTHPQTPSALSIGTTENPDLAFHVGRVTGSVLSLLGFNMNLAPVVDLSDPFQLSFIGNRSFGNNPTQVFLMSSHFANGLVRENVLPTFKHFPGHGGAISDSHISTPIKLSSLEELYKTDLLPFLEICKKSSAPSAIMVGHISFPNIDASGVPATFSNVLLTQILRDKLNYSGLIITDDIEMHGSTTIKNVGDRAVSALLAGADMVMVAWTKKSQRIAFQAVLNAVKNGSFSKKELNQKLRRIIYAKLKFPPNELFKSNPNQFRSEFKNQLSQLTNQSHVIVENILKKQENRLEIESNIRFNKITKYIIFSGDHLFYNTFKSFSKKPVQLFKLSPGKSFSIEKTLKENGSLQPIFYVTGIGTAKILNSLPVNLKKQFIVVNSMNPGIINQRHHYQSIIDINTRNHLSAKWLVQSLENTLTLREPANKKSSLKTISENH